jgi:hypothetical protein
MEDRMKKAHEPSESKIADVGLRQPAKKGKETEDPCDKAFNQETARLKDEDKACDDGVH